MWVSKWASQLKTILVAKWEVPVSKRESLPKRVVTHTLPIVSPRCAIHTENRSQFSPLASEIPERRRDAGPLVFVARAILSYI